MYLHPELNKTRVCRIYIVVGMQLCYVATMMTFICDEVCINEIPNDLNLCRNISVRLMRFKCVLSYTDDFDLDK